MLCFCNSYNTISLPVFSVNKKLAGYSVKSMIMLFMGAELVVAVVEMVVTVPCQPTVVQVLMLCS